VAKGWMVKGLEKEEREESFVVVADEKRRIFTVLSKSGLLSQLRSCFGED
jgi:hypothetical protein